MNPLPLITIAHHLFHPPPNGSEEGLECQLPPDLSPDALISHQGEAMRELDPHTIKQYRYPHKQEPDETLLGSCSPSCHLPHPMRDLYTEAIPVSLMKSMQALDREGVFPHRIGIHFPAMLSSLAPQIPAHHGYLNLLLSIAACEGVVVDAHPLFLDQLLDPLRSSCCHQERDILFLEEVYHIYSEELPVQVEAFDLAFHLSEALKQLLDELPLAHPSLYHHHCQGISLVVLYQVDGGKLIELARSIFGLTVDDVLLLLRVQLLLIDPSGDGLEVNSHLPLPVEDGFGDEACQGLIEPVGESVNIQGVEFVEDSVRMRGVLKLSGCLLDGFLLSCGVAESGDDLLGGIERSLWPWQLEPFLEVVEGECIALLVEQLAWGVHGIHLLVIWFWVCPTLFNVQIDFGII